jgi:beta-galactosidase/evolved beta-galactosidase subunit alpha
VRLRLHNRYDFIGLDHLRLSWTLAEDGQPFRSGNLPTPSVAPGASADIEVPCRVPRPAPGAVYHLLLRFTLAGDTAWAEAGHEVAFAQFELPIAAPLPLVAALDRSALAPVHCRQVGTHLHLDTGDFALTFDTARGIVHHWSVAGTTLVTAGPRLTLWRAPIDNERIGSGEAVNRRWRERFLHLVQHRLDDFAYENLDDGTARVTVHTTVAPPVYEAAYDCRTTYTVLGSGDVLLQVEGTPRGEWPMMIPRVGLEMTLPTTLDHVAWLGRGPGESYVDSKSAARFGFWKGTVDELFTPYVFPQENGNHTDTHWVALSDGRGTGLLAVGDPQLDFSAHRFSTEDLDRARHTSDLQPRDSVTLHLDWRQNGIGSNSCGPALLDKYQLKAEPFTFRLRLRPLLPGGLSPLQVGRHGVQLTQFAPTSPV